MVLSAASCWASRCSRSSWLTQQSFAAVASISSMLREHLVPGGTLLLTTPRSGAVSTATPIGQLYAALSPGAHYFLLSPGSLRALLERAGFTFVEIYAFGMTNVAVASDVKQENRGPVDVPARLMRYYGAKLDAQDARVRLGNQINYYVAATRCGDFKDHEAISLRIDSELRDLFGIDLGNPHRLIDAVMQELDLVGLGKVMPYGLPFYLHHLGLNGQGDHARVGVLEAQALAAFLAVRGLQIDFQNLFVYHDLYECAWPAATGLASKGTPPRVVELNRRTHSLAAKVPEIALKNGSLLLRARRKLIRVAERMLGLRIPAR
jgi:hypothetical protein